VAACPQGLGRARNTFVRRHPEDRVLHQLVREHLETFLAEVRARNGGDGLPRFVERELREFLSCGVLAGGFARFRCEACGLEIYASADLLERTFAIDILACPECGGSLRFLATIEQRSLIEEILGHLGLPVDVPQPTPARSPTFLPGVETPSDWITE
jgi:hypothetical protein